MGAFWVVVGHFGIFLDVSKLLGGSCKIFLCDSGWLCFVLVSFLVVVVCCGIFLGGSG